MKWRGLRSLFSGQSDEAQLRERVAAYRRLFSPESQDAQIVMADLAHYTGFYRASGPGMPPDDRAFADGMRAAYGRLFRYANLTDEELMAMVSETVEP